jgi:hypothetical protein
MSTNSNFLLDVKRLEKIERTTGMRLIYMDNDNDGQEKIIQIWFARQIF